jgi:hypothetical protein
MNNITSIIPIVRTLINDIESARTDIFVYTSSSLFTLTEKNIVGITSVMVNDIESGVTYEVDITTGKINITSPLSVDDVVQIDYTCHSNYSDTEITSYIKSALVHLSVNNVQTYYVEGVNLNPEPSDAESNLIATIAGIIINPQNVSYRMPDISVMVPKDLNTLDKIRKVIAIYKKDNSGFMFIAEDKVPRDVFGQTNGLGIWRQDL